MIYMQKSRMNFEYVRLMSFIEARLSSCMSKFFKYES